MDISKLDDITTMPIDQVPTIEFVEHRIELPLKKSTAVTEFDLVPYGKSTYDDNWGEVEHSTSLASNGILQVDILLLGYEISFVMSPVVFLARGKCDGYPACADWTAPWRVVREIVDNYNLVLTYQQRFALLNEPLRNVARVVPDSAEGMGEVVINTYAKRLNEIMAQRGMGDPFEPSDLVSALTQVERFTIAKSPQRFPTPVYIERGVPLAPKLSQYGSVDWTGLAVVARPMVDGFRQVVIPAGGFRIVIEFKGLEVQGEQRQKIRELRPEWDVGGQFARRDATTPPVTRLATTPRNIF